MQFTQELSDFNALMVTALQGTFNPNVKPVQDEQGRLLFRGPILNNSDPSHIGTHVVVSLDDDVRDTLNRADPEQREEMTQLLLDNLGTQVRSQYDPKAVGQYAQEYVGTMSILQ